MFFRFITRIVLINMNDRTKEIVRRALLGVVTGPVPEPTNHPAIVIAPCKPSVHDIN